MPARGRDGRAQGPPPRPHWTCWRRTRGPHPPPSGSDPGEGSASPTPPRARTSTAVVPGACGGRTLCTSSLADATSPGTLRRSQPEGPAQAPALAGTQRHGHTGCCSGPGIRTLAAGAGGAGASALLTRQPETRGSPLTSQTPRFTRKPRTRDTPRSRLHLITAKRTLTGDGLGGPKLQAPLSSLWGQDTSPLPPCYRHNVHRTRLRSGANVTLPPPPPF